MNWQEINQMLIKEHVGLFKAANEYDIFDLTTGEQILECREEKIGIFTKLLRFTDYKRYTPFHIELFDKEGNCVVQVKRGISLFLSKVTVLDGGGKCIGGFSQKLFSIGGKFEVVDAEGEFLCMLKGSWTSWDFSFESKEEKFAHVSKEWAGLGKELFTSADNYVLDINPIVERDSDLKKLILASVMCIDMVLKE